MGTPRCPHMKHLIWGTLAHHPHRGWAQMQDAHCFGFICSASGPAHNCRSSLLPSWMAEGITRAYKEVDCHSEPPTSSPSHKSSESEALLSPVIPIHPFLSRAQPLRIEHPHKINSLSLPPFSLHLKQLLLVINRTASCE